jgi:hypothetical protein
MSIKLPINVQCHWKIEIDLKNSDEITDECAISLQNYGSFKK